MTNTEKHAKLVNEKLKKYEKDRANRVGMMMTLEDADDWELALTKFEEYLDNPYTLKDRNSLYDFIDELVENSTK